MNVIFYAVVYSLMTLGAFGVLSALERKGKLLELNDLRGLGKEQPLLAGLLAVFMLSLAGVPPLAGFMAKYLIFGSAIQAGIATSSHLLIVCAVVGILASVMGAFYYLRVIGAMYFRPKPTPAPEASEPEGFEPTAHWAPVAGAVLLGLLVLLVGVYPSTLFDPIALFYGADGYLTYFMR
jgi:NADH-quinone oxidoreductase subunit N